jgi:glutathione S-transferase
MRPHDPQCAALRAVMGLIKPADAMAMIKIFGQARSRAFRVIWLCLESQIPFEHQPVTINVQDAGCKEEWYVALNPNARVPTIDDDGFTLWESAAINLYLAEKYASPLYPRSPEEKGRMLQWAFFVANDVEEPMITVFINRNGFPKEKCDPMLAERAERELPIKLKILEQQLGKTEYFGGERWDMSDFVVASTLYLLFVIKYDFSAFPKLGQWLAASVERPAAREARLLREIR